MNRGQGRGRSGGYPDGPPGGGGWGPHPGMHPGNQSGAPPGWGGPDEQPPWGWNQPYQGMPNGMEMYHGGQQGFNQGGGSGGRWGGGPGAPYPRNANINAGMPGTNTRLDDGPPVEHTTVLDPSTMTQAQIVATQWCNRGSRCRRAGCHFSHTPQGVEPPRIQRRCEKGMSCEYSTCRFLHPPGWRATIFPPGYSGRNDGPEHADVATHLAPTPLPTAGGQPHGSYEIAASHAGGMDVDGGRGAAMAVDPTAELTGWTHPRPQVGDCFRGLLCTRSVCKFKHPDGWAPASASTDAALARSTRMRNVILQPSLLPSDMPAALVLSGTLGVVVDPAGRLAAALRAHDGSVGKTIAYEADGASAWGRVSVGSDDVADAGPFEWWTGGDSVTPSKVVPGVKSVVTEQIAGTDGDTDAE